MLTCTCCRIYAVEVIWLDRGAGPRQTWRLWQQVPGGRIAHDHTTVDELAAELERLGIRMWD